MTCSYHNTLRRLVYAIGGILFASTFLLAANPPAASTPPSLAKAMQEEIAAMAQSRFGGDRWMFQDQFGEWALTNVPVEKGHKLRIDVKAHEAFPTLLVIHVATPDRLFAKMMPDALVPTNHVMQVAEPVGKFMKIVDDFFSVRKSETKRFQPHLLFEIDGRPALGYYGYISDIELEDKLYVESLLIDIDDYYTTYYERLSEFRDGAARDLWKDSEVWETPSYARSARTREQVAAAALFPYTNFIRIIQSRVGGVTWMQAHSNLDGLHHRILRGEPGVGVKIVCNIETSSPPTVVKVDIRTSASGDLKGDENAMSCRRIAGLDCARAIERQFGRLRGDWNCFRPLVEIHIDGDLYWDIPIKDVFTMPSPLTEDFEDLVISNVWNAQMLKCTPDALFDKQAYSMDRFEFSEPERCRFQSSLVSPTTVAWYSNAICRIRKSFSGTNIVEDADGNVKGIVVVSDLRAGVVPSILEVLLDDSIDYGDSSHLDSLAVFNETLSKYSKTLPDLAPRFRIPFKCRFLQGGKEIVLPDDGHRTPKQQAGRQLIWGNMWSEGQNNNTADKTMQLDLEEK